MGSHLPVWVSCHWCRVCSYPFSMPAVALPPADSLTGLTWFLCFYPSYHVQCGHLPTFSNGDSVLSDLGSFSGLFTLMGCFLVVFMGQLELRSLIFKDYSTTSATRYQNIFCLYLLSANDYR